MLYFNRPHTQLKNYGPWMHVDHFLTPEECKKIIEIMPAKGMDEAKVNESAVTNTSIRSAKLWGLHHAADTQWIFEKLENAILHCNQDIYQFDILGFYEMIQLIRYDEGDHYDWHQDFSNLNHSNRKLSVSIQLSPSEDYEGGELEFFRNGTAPKGEGDFILFPSFMHHKVHPITKGTRYALVAWVSGAPYR